MKCPKCQFENREDAKFCKKCGTNLELTCPSCGHPYQQDSIFCDECGHRLHEVAKAEELALEPEGERKHVTVLFSDLSGYTAMSEKLDPEEVKDITSRTFGEVSKIVNKYEGFIEKFVGDAVMALFGVPKAHEDDPTRAIRAAREIDELVEDMGSKLEEKVGQPLSMNTGINTGIVVTGEVDVEKGTHGVAGETINLASRLSSFAKSDEILVGAETYHQAEGYFDFGELTPTEVKGKEEPVRVHKLLSAKEKPVTLRRLSGLRAELIGRKVEMARLGEAVERLEEGKGSIFSVCGDAGTGKSRLVEEFKANLDLKEIQWLEGHAYACAQNIPYFPLVDFLSGVFRIEEGDPPETVKEKVESGIEGLVGKKEDIAPYIGSLYSLSYPEVEDVSPEFWKVRLQDAIQAVLTAIAQRRPTIFFLEDLQWADPSFMELLRHTLLEVRQPAIVLCAYRPLISLFKSHQLGAISKIYQEILLQDLSPSEAEEMVGSLLRTDTIPSELREFVQKKLEGNPFYLEEVVNSLIESRTLMREGGTWKLTRHIGESDISSTIHGVISARLDRLEKQTKRLLQEASVIGRAFLYRILKKVTELEEQCDSCLSGLERLDLIRTRSLEPELEYMFKHALTQDMVYNGLLKKERREIHERIGMVMEQIFQDRLPEFYETLAFHFKQGKSVHKAVDYLMKSGEKSLKRYAVEESHQYYKEAFEIISDKPDRTKGEDALLIDILTKWAYVFDYQGDVKGWNDLFVAHKDLAESLDDKARQGMFYAWLSFSLYHRGNPKDAYTYSHRALKLGEEINSKEVLGYACTFLAFACSELGIFDQAISYAKRAQEISRAIGFDHYLFYVSHWAMGNTYAYMGESTKLHDLAEILLDYGRRHSNIRSLVVSQVISGMAHWAEGDCLMAIEHFKRGLRISADPYYIAAVSCKVCLGWRYCENRQFEEAEKMLREAESYSRDFGSGLFGTIVQGLLGIVNAAKGEISEGLKMIEEARQELQKRERRFCQACMEGLLGNVFLQIVEGARPKSLSTVTKNIGFLIKSLPLANKKAEHHLNKAIEISKDIGAKVVSGQVYLDLGLLHKAKNRTEKARECISEAIQLFEQCEAKTYLKQAKEALASLR